MSLVVHTEGVCGGRARIAGTRIDVHHIWNLYHNSNMSVKEIRNKMYPWLTFEQVKAAVEYGEANQKEMWANIRANA